MSEKILLNRQKFFFNQYKKSSHIQFLLQSDKKIIQEDSFNVNFLRNNNVIFNTTAKFNSDNNYYDVIYKQGLRKLQLSGTNIDGMDGVYTQTSVNSNCYSLTYIHDEETTTYYISHYDNSLITDESQKKRNWYIGTYKVFDNILLQADKLYFKSKQTDGSLLPPYQFQPFLDDADVKNYPIIKWINNGLVDSIEPVNMKITNFKKDYQYPKSFNKVFYLGKENEWVNLSTKIKYNYNSIPDSEKPYIIKYKTNNIVISLTQNTNTITKIDETDYSNVQASESLLGTIIQKIEFDYQYPISFTKKDYVSVSKQGLLDQFQWSITTKNYVYYLTDDETYPNIRKYKNSNDETDIIIIKFKQNNDNILKINDNSYVELTSQEINNAPSSAGLTGIVIEDINHIYPISFNFFSYICKYNSDEDNYYWDKINSSLIKYEQDSTVQDINQNNIFTRSFKTDDIIIEFKNKTSIISKINEVDYSSYDFTSTPTSQQLNIVKNDISFDYQYPLSFKKWIYTCTKQENQDVYYWKKSDNSINYIYDITDDLSKLNVRKYKNSENIEDIITITFTENTNTISKLNDDDYPVYDINSTPSSDLLNNTVSIIELNQLYDLIDDLSSEISFVLDEYQSFNANDYNGDLHDCVKDQISYGRNKTLSLDSLTYEDNYDYNFQIVKISNEQNNNTINNFAQKVSFAEGTANSTFDFSKITGVFRNGTESNKFFNHICKNYIIEACHVPVSESSDSWTFRLFEAIKYGKQNLTFQYLQSLVSSEITFSYQDTTGTVITLDDIHYKIVYDDDTDIWYIISLNETQTNQTVSGFNFPTKFSQQGKIIGAIVDFNFYHAIGQNPGFSNAISVSINVSSASVNSYRYRLFYGNNWKTNFVTYIGNNYHFQSTNGFMKGRLLDIKSNIANFNNEVKFSYLLKDLCYFKFNSSFITSLKMVQYVIQDQQFSLPCTINNYSFDFNSLDASKKISISGDIIFNYLNTNNDLYFLNDKYKLISIVYNNNGDMSLPYIQQHEIIYFENNIVIDFYNEAKTYVKSSGKDGIFEFNLKYGYYDGNNVKQYINVNNYKLNFNKIQVSDVNGNYNSITNSSSTFDDYPFKWDQVEFCDYDFLEQEYEQYVQEIENSSSSEINLDKQRLYFSKNNQYQYQIKLPFGSPPDIQRQYIIVPSDYYSGSLSFAGNYYLMTYQQVNIARNLTGSNAFDEDSYTDLNKIYKYTYAKDATVVYYIKLVNDYWCIVSDINVTSTDSSNLMVRAGYNINNDGYSSPLTAFKSCYLKGSWKNINKTFQKQQGQSENGQSKKLHIRLTDKYDNITNITTGNIIIHQTIPTELNLRIVGSDGSSNYTGFYQKLGRFFPSEFVTLQFSAQSAIAMKYKLTGNIMISSSDTNTWKQLPNSKNCVIIAKINPPINEYENLLDSDEKMTIKLEVKDSAGNSNQITSSIQYISRLFRTLNQHLISQTSSYSHTLYSKSGSQITAIVKSRVSQTEFVRSWNEIWFPSTHGVPLNEDGSIDVQNATRISKSTDTTGQNGPTALELNLYDRLTLDATGNALAVDSEGRYYQNMDSWNSEKTYRSMLNSTINNNVYDTYWIIDNTGNIDFNLQFQVFDFNSNITSIPANLAAPYDGDMLCVYDASDDDAVQITTDQYGNKKYTLIDSTKLSLLFTLKGSYTNKTSSDGSQFSMIDSKISGSLTSNGNYGFITPSINTCSRICLVPFSDSGSTSDSVGTGFKLKAGPKHAVNYNNYDGIEETGEFWVHKSPEVLNGSWTSCSSLAINYQYYGSFATTDYDEGIIIFDQRLENPLITTFNAYLYLNSDETFLYPYSYYSYYYNYKKGTYITSDQIGDIYPHCLHDFITTEDDIVDYTQPVFYVVSEGLDLPKSAIYDFSKYTIEQSGKLAAGYTFQKDTGIFNFTDIVPLGRFLCTYYYHTFYRLTSDGYGDLYFYGTGVLVPATADDSHKDWAYVDLKLVNEGTNTLNSGKLQFLARGYISKGTVIDTVLDEDRPWDVQEGTTAETVSRAGAVCASSYSSLDAANRVNAFKAKGSQTCTFGTLAPKSHVYLRVFWCIANDENGTSWIECTRGTKCFSAQLSGLYYIFSTGV